MIWIIAIIAILIGALIDFGISYLIVKLVCMALGVAFNIIWVWILFLIWFFILSSLKVVVDK